jgi:LPXTG-motif cell wall-anchored protein
VLASNDGLGDQVVTVDLTTAKLTPFVQHLGTTKGLVYLDASGTQTSLALNGTTAAPASTPIKNTSTSGKSGGSSDTALIVIIIGAVLLLGGGGYWLRRRGAAS